MNQTQRSHVLFTGNVQGVGFRFVTEALAVQSGLTGFVKNLSNGNVEIVGEGDKQQLEAFLEDIRQNMCGHISDSCVDGEPTKGEFSSFEIRF